MDIWAACRGHIEPGSLMGKLVRVVESQEQIATRELVDSLDEQALLEDMLERSKPVLPPGLAKLHYLLATPFRYPPLPHGSRFGSRFEPGLLYGSKTVPTVLAETAYYRFVFWSGMAQPPRSGKLRTQHTLFAASYRTAKGLSLYKQPFSKYQQVLTAADDYRSTQQLGTAMRNADIEAFEYISSRDPEQGLNVALIYHRALGSRRPLYQQRWLCETTHQVVSFSSRESDRVYRYEQGIFLVNGLLPKPAV